MLYHNPYTGQFFNPDTDTLTVGETVIYTPSPETLAKAGYQPATVPDASPSDSTPPTLEQAIADKVSAIEAYDTSDAVNSFSIGEHSGWIGKNDRAAFNQSLSRYIANGRDTCELWLGDTPVIIPCEAAVVMLGALCDYADECFIVTHRHIAQVRAMTSVDDVLAFDITAGYPPKLNFVV